MLLFTKMVVIRDVMVYVMIDLNKTVVNDYLELRQLEFYLNMFYQGYLND